MSLKEPQIGGGILSPLALAHSGSSSPPLVVSPSPINGGSVELWNTAEIVSWLHEQGLPQYVDSFKDQFIISGSVLLQLTEEHLEQMGISCIGHRLMLINAIDQLRHKAGLLPSAKFVNVDYLLEELDIARSRRCLKYYPKRIILIRHAESQGNVDRSVYSSIPDAKLTLTEKGKIQATEAGLKLKELLGMESCGFYVSPFLRSRQTFEGIRKAFPKEQVLYEREDPRIREQEWGNFQIPSKMADVMKERRRIGAFFYRFLTGESGADVFDRVSIFLESLYRDMGKGKCGDNVIIVSHGLFCRLFLTRFYHWQIEYFHRLWNFENCQFAVMELQEEGYFKLMSSLKADP